MGPVITESRRSTIKPSSLTPLAGHMHTLAGPLLCFWCCSTQPSPPHFSAAASPFFTTCISSLLPRPSSCFWPFPSCFCLLVYGRGKREEMHVVKKGDAPVEKWRVEVWIR